MQSTLFGLLTPAAPSRHFEDTAVEGHGHPEPPLPPEAPPTPEPPKPEIDEPDPAEAPAPVREPGDSPPAVA